MVNGKQESVKEGENNYSPTSLSKSLHILFAVAAHEGRLIKGIDITCAFGSEFLTEEDGDIFVEFPEVLDQHFGDLLDEQLEEQQPMHSCRRREGSQQRLQLDPLGYVQ